MKNLRSLPRRKFLQGAALTLGTTAFLRTALTPGYALAEEHAGVGTIHSFSKGGLKFHTYVSPADGLGVTSHIVEFSDRLMLVDATFLESTAQEVTEFIASTGKPVSQALLSHEHPDHWGGASFIKGVTFDTLPEVREGLMAEATSGDFPEPTNVLKGGVVEPGVLEISGVSVEYRQYSDNEAPHMLVIVLPEQKVAIVQDLVYNGVFFAPGVNRTNWIATLEELRDDPAFETLLVGHGLPTTRGELDNAISYIKVLDDAMTNSSTPDIAMDKVKAAYPGYTGEFLLGLIAEYWVE